MRSKNLLFLLVLVLGCGLIAAGCGDDDSTTAETTATEATTTAEDTTAEDTEATTEETTSDDSSSGEIDSEGVYDACVDAIEGTAAEAAGETACAQARDAFEQCAQQAEALPEENSAREDAIAICQEAADQAIKSLEAAG